jgi:polyhydroxyalkanoate synthesis regulator phasin
MATEYEIYRDELLKNPEFKIKYLLAKEKLNIELIIDSIDEAINKKSSLQTMKRRISKLRKHVAAMNL